MTEPIPQEETIELGNPQDVLQKLIDHDIDLTTCEIVCECGPRRYIHYLDGWRDNEDPHIKLTFWHQTLQPEQRRAIKKLTGKMQVGEGNSPNLVGVISVKNIRVEFVIRGSYECETICHPKGDFADVRDEMTAPMPLED